MSPDNERTREVGQADKLDRVDPEFLSPSKLERINYKKRKLFVHEWAKLLEFIRNKGKHPKKRVGYAESNIPSIARRIFQTFEFTWDNHHTTLILSQDNADEFVCALKNDDILTREGEPYNEDSKRQFVEALGVYFRFRGEVWESDINFSRQNSARGSDPFRKRERELLLDAALEFKTPPSYSNVTPTERDRWNRHLAQYLGKSKDNISPSDWSKLQQSWKVPSLISTALDAGWRCTMVGRLLTNHCRLEKNLITIPGSVAVKNDEEWEVELSDRSVKMMESWLQQRSNIEKYDDSEHIWLNRKGNPYNSKNLNNLLRNLISNSEFEKDGRKLTWHSIRHSVGLYTYDRTEDLGMVAEILRQKSLEAAKRYAHPTPEAKRAVVEDFQKFREER